MPTGPTSGHFSTRKNHMKSPVLVLLPLRRTSHKHHRQERQSHERQGEAEVKPLRQPKKRWNSAVLVRWDGKSNSGLDMGRKFLENRLVRTPCPGLLILTLMFCFGFGRIPARRHDSARFENWPLPFRKVYKLKSHGNPWQLSAVQFETQ